MIVVLIVAHVGASSGIEPAAAIGAHGTAIITAGNRQRRVVPSTRIEVGGCGIVLLIGIHAASGIGVGAAAYGEAAIVIAILIFDGDVRVVTASETEDTVKTFSHGSE
jgi:hypothetical protein